MVKRAALPEWYRLIVVFNHAGALTLQEDHPIDLLPMRLEIRHHFHCMCFGRVFSFQNAICSVHIYESGRWSVHIMGYDGRRQDCSVRDCHVINGRSSRALLHKGTNKILIAVHVNLLLMN